MEMILVLRGDMLDAGHPLGEVHGLLGARLLKGGLREATAARSRDRRPRRRNEGEGWALDAGSVEDAN